MGKPVVHFEINAKNGKKSQEFYSKLFDWKVDANNPMDYGMVSAEKNAGIGGGIGQTQGNETPYVTFYVQVENLQATLDHAERLGGKTILPPTEIPNVVTMAMFQDPDGNKIGLVKG